MSRGSIFGLVCVCNICKWPALFVVSTVRLKNIVSFNYEKYNVKCYLTILCPNFLQIFTKLFAQLQGKFQAEHQESFEKQEISTMRYREELIALQNGCSFQLYDTAHIHVSKKTQVSSYKLTSVILYFRTLLKEFHFQ